MFGWRKSLAGLVLLGSLLVVPAAHAAPARRAAIGTHYARIVADCAAPAPGHSSCYVLRRVPATSSTPGAQPYVVRSSYPIGPAHGYTPADIWSAYGLGNKTSLTASGGPGTGHTVAIVDAYDDPDIEADLGTFDAEYGLPACTTANGCFEKVGQTGSATSLPPAAGSTGWDVETSLDVEAVHATCPDCKVLLVEANSSFNTDLATAVDTAVSLGANEVTNSYGSPEATNSTVQASYDHPGVVITASAGDNGYYNWDKPSLAAKANTPSAYPTVVAVGGTALDLNSDGTRSSESVWNDDVGAGAAAGGSGASGGGCSALFTAELWQSSVSGWSATGCGTYRLASDVSAVGDPLTGVDIYDSYSLGGWATVGGTSLSSPVIASIYALAGGAQGVDYPSETLYSGFSSSPSALYDVTSGGNGWCDGASVADCGTPPAARDDCGGTTACDAAAGYDGPSGVGSPDGLADFAPVIASFTMPSSGSASTPVNVDGSASISSVDAITSWHWDWGDGSSDTTSSAQASHTYTPGVYTVTLTASTAAGHASVPVTHTINIDTPVPANNSVPTITGTDADLSVLSEHHGDWSGSPTGYAYQWQRCDSDGTNCADIRGATAQTYRLIDADVGHTLDVVEKAENAAGYGTPVSSALTPVIVAAPAPTTAGFGQVTGSPAPTGGSPTKVVISPLGGLLAVTNSDDDDVSMFKIDADGKLSEIAGSPFATGDDPYSVAFSPDGKLLAAGNIDDPSVSVFSVAADGTLTPVTGSPFAVGVSGSPGAIAFSPDGSLLAVADIDYNNGAGGLHTFSVGDGGYLSEVHGSPLTPLSGWPAAVAFSPGGDLLAVTTQDNNKVNVFSVSSDGALAAAPGSPHTVGHWPTAVAFSPGGGLLAVANVDDSTLSVFSVGAGGALSTVSGSPYTTPSAPNGLAFSETGGLVAIAGSGGDLGGTLVDSVGPGGALTPVQDQPLDGFATSNVFGQQSVAFSPGGGLMAVANQDTDKVYTFFQNPTATISTPAGGGTYSLGDVVPATYSCQDSAEAPGIATCADNHGGSGGTGTLDTSAPGTHYYEVKATSKDGTYSYASISYTVNGPPAPTNTAPPSITGTTQVGQTLTEHHGSWSGSPTSYDYQWQRCDSGGSGCGDISGEVGQTYTLTSADLGHTIVVQETAQSGGVKSAPAASAATAVVAQAPSGGGGSTGGGGGGNTAGSGGSTPPAGPGPSAPVTPPTPAGASTQQIERLLAAVTVPHGKSASIRRLLKSHGLTLTVSSPGPGSLVVSWYVVPRGARVTAAKRRHRRPKPILIATGRVRFHGAGRAKLKIKLTGRGKRTLKHTHRLKLTGKSAFTAPHAGAVVSVKRFTLKR